VVCGLPLENAEVCLDLGVAAEWFVAPHGVCFMFPVPACAAEILEALKPGEIKQHLKYDIWFKFYY